jgi:hypothetical protein
LSKNIQDAQPGDIIFFLNDVNPKWPYHTMVFIGNDNIGDFRKIDDWVIYHTGQDENNAGIVKKIRLKDLQKHPNKRWHPIFSNPYFLGFYRWKILEQ